MDERSHNPYPGATPNPDSRAPWPSYNSPVDGAPIQGHVPHQQPQQFHYATEGFVLPGAPAGHPSMAAQGNIIGMAHPQQGYAPVMGGGVAHPYAHQQPQFQAQPHLSYQQAPQAHGQTWAYPTPYGMQVVSGSGAATVPVQPEPHAAAIQPVTANRKRLRWESVVPTLAVACLIAAVGLFISDFDRMTGRSGAAPADGAKAATDKSDMAGMPGMESSGDSAGIVAQAKEMRDAGNFDGAASLLHPLLEGDSPAPEIMQLHMEIDAANIRNAALLTKLGVVRQRKDWPAVATTINQLELLRPLTPELTTLRANAIKASGGRVPVAKAAGPSVQATITRARALDVQGKTQQAITLLEKAIAQNNNPRLKRLREQFSAKLAGPSKPAASSGSGTTGGGKAPAPPAAGGTRPTTPSAARPPASVPAGDMPPLPDAPNPHVGHTEVAPTVAG